MSRRAHLQNEELKKVLYWMERGELAPHALRKAWQWRVYDGRVEVGEPVATEHWSVEELEAAGIVGLWGYRRCEGLMDTAPRVNCGTLIAMLRDAGHDDLADEVVRRATEGRSVPVHLKPGEETTRLVRFRAMVRPTFTLDTEDE